MAKRSKPLPADKPNGLRVLFAASEALPFIKTGGLADVAGSLPPALRSLGHDVRLVMPAYPQVLERVGRTREIATLTVAGFNAPVRLLTPQGQHGLPLYLVDCPLLFQRVGNPYLDAEGRDWGDNATRFGVFCRAVVEIALDRAGLDWRPEVVHAHDWQAGLVPALLAGVEERPATLFTIHNLAYQGVFAKDRFQALHLPSKLWSLSGVEFHGGWSFIKGGIAFADQLTTVSPSYAREIRTAAFGVGLEGLLDHRAERLSGVLNGIDYETWNPGSDPLIAQHYGSEDFELKRENTRALREELGLPDDGESILFGHVGRLVSQKGVDLILDILPELMKAPVQLVILGTGDPAIERTLRARADAFPGRIAAVIDYDEGLAHRIEAGADAFLMPSRFEPCGLNQIYSLRYGTVPIVRRTGGLADTVVDLTPDTLSDGSATGFVFGDATPQALLNACERAITLYQKDDGGWRTLATTGMRGDFSWQASATRYVKLYRRAMDDPAPSPVG